MPNLLFIALILLPVLSSCLIAIEGGVSGTMKSRRALVATTLALQCLLSVLVFLEGDQSQLLFHLSPHLPVALRSDALARYSVVIISFLWTFTGAYSFKYMEHVHNEKRFYTFYMLILGALMAMCLADTLITLFIFFEAVTFLSMALFSIEKSKETTRASLRFLVYAIISAVLCFVGLLLTAPNTATPYFVPGGSLLPPGQFTISVSAMLGAVFVGCVGFASMADMFPLHGWLPAAHPVASAPASAILSSVIAKMGILGIIRYLYYVVGPEFIRHSWVQTLLLAFALITVFIGSMLALRQNVLKKRLAYSSMSQLSYILCGVFLLNQTALDGALLHMFFHALTKSALYMCAGAIIFYTGRTELDQLHALGTRMPVTMTLFTIASLGLVGIPPMGGFISKWYLMEGAITGTGLGVFTWLVPAVLLVSALLTAAYLLPISISAFYDDPKKSAGMDRLCPTRLSARMETSMLILVAALIGFGLFPGALINFFQAIADTLV
ncbi:MAG: proton-conducting transporter membrane subunit [Eubacteriales bacterium]|nr:proton-conducting transporter membrane subunit [Eubacteriales bacterium]